MSDMKIQGTADVENWDRVKRAGSHGWMGRNR